MGIPYTVDHRLVRGLDYYTRTVFEIQPAQEGSQSTICGGGRYDGLIEQIGGRPTPGIGFATGMERMVLNLKRDEVEVPDEPKTRYLVASTSEKTRDAAVRIASGLKRAGVRSHPGQRLEEPAGAAPAGQRPGRALRGHRGRGGVGEGTGERS